MRINSNYDRGFTITVVVLAAAILVLADTWIIAALAFVIIVLMGYFMDRSGL